MMTVFTRCVVILLGRWHLGIHFIAWSSFVMVFSIVCLNSLSSVQKTPRYLVICLLSAMVEMGSPCSVKERSSGMSRRFVIMELLVADISIPYRVMKDVMMLS